MNGEVAVRPLKVMQLGSPTGMFGAERWILALCRYLPRERILSTIAVVKDEPGGEPALCAHARTLGIDTVEIEAFGRVNLRAVSQIRQLLMSRQIDVLHTHGYKPDILGMLATAGTDCRLMSTPHGWSADAGLKVRLYEALERLAFARFDAIVPLSQDLLNGLSRYPWLRRKLSLVRNAVDLAEIAECRTYAIELSELRSTGAFVFGYVGQLIARKRVDVLIRALARLPGSDAHLVLVGEGPLGHALQSLVRQVGLTGRVHFFGFRDDRIAFVKGLDVFVLPSVLEGIPRAMMEAMAAGVPAIGSDIEGVRTLIKHEQTGLLFEPDNEAGLALCMQRLRDEEALRKQLALAGRLMVNREFAPAGMAAAYLSQYERLVAM